MIALLSALELAHLIIWPSRNPEKFAATTGLSGIVVGLFVGQKT